MPIALTLYTDAFIVRGTIDSRERRISDILNHAEHDFLVLGDVTLDEYGTRSLAERAEYAQVNLATVLFAVANDIVEPAPELRMPKVSEMAMISLPPFRITGRIHLLPERNLATALAELTGRFLPVTEATYWSDVVAEARQTASMVAVNHARTQVLAPHRIVDPWAGLEAGASAEPPAAAVDDDRRIGGRRPSAARRRVRGRRSVRVPRGCGLDRRVGAGRRRRSLRLDRGSPRPDRTTPGPMRDPRPRSVGQRSTGRSSRSPHSAQPPS